MKETELHKELTFAGYTNGYQLLYAKEDDGGGLFYKDTQGDCFIPLYILKRHHHRVAGTTDGNVIVRHRDISWIAVDLLLPENDTVVIGCCDDDVFECTHKEDGRFEANGKNITKVKFWMPLPEPYRWEK